MAFFLFPELSLGCFFAFTIASGIVGSFSAVFGLVLYSIGLTLWIVHNAFLLEVKASTVMAFLIGLAAGLLDLASTVGFQLEAFKSFPSREGIMLQGAIFEVGIDLPSGLALLVFSKVVFALFFARMADLGALTAPLSRSMSFRGSFFEAIYRLRGRIQRDERYERGIRVNRAFLRDLRRRIAAGEFIEEYYVHARLLYGFWWAYELVFLLVIGYNSAQLALPALSAFFFEFLGLIVLLTIFPIWLDFRMLTRGPRQRRSSRGREGRN